MTEKLRENLLSDVEVRAMISSRAHELYRLGGQEHGRDLEDWFQAENEILALASLVENQIQYVLSLPDQKSETNLFDIFLRLCRDLTNHARSGHPVMRDLLEAHLHRVPRLIRQIMAQGAQPQLQKRPASPSVKLGPAKEKAS